MTTKDPASMKLIVNIPAYNEEEKIAQTIRRIGRSYDGIETVEIQVVDDGSSDKTGSAAKEAGADYIYTHPTNRGIGVTFRTAVEHALENGADIMVNIDADGQFDPEDIGKLTRPILEGKSDMVIADRFTESSATNIPWIKDRLNRLAARIVSCFLKTRIDDLTCGFRALNRETMLRLNLPGDFTYTQETIIDAIGKNLKIMWIPVRVTYFADRKSRVVRSVYQFVNNSARIIVRAVRDVRPMKFFGIPGIILMTLAIVMFGVFVFFYFQDFKISPYRNWFIGGSVFFLVGLQFLVFALIADMIKTNRRLIEDLAYRVKKERFNKD